MTIIYYFRSHSPETLNDYICDKIDLPVAPKKCKLRQVLFHMQYAMKRFHMSLVDQDFVLNYERHKNFEDIQSKNDLV